MSNRGRHKKRELKYPNTWLTKVMTETQLDLLFQRAHEQNKYPSLKDVEKSPTSASIIIWSYTPEGWNFWNDILSKVDCYKLRNLL